MEKINYKDACRIMEQGEFCEVMKLLKDMGINPKTSDGNFKKLSVILYEVFKYFNINGSQYLNNVKYLSNVKENMRYIFPYSASYLERMMKESIWAWILYHVVSEDALKYCVEEDEDEEED